MTTQLETWERKYYVAGGGDPFLFYVCNRLIEHQAFGQVIPDCQEIKVASLPRGVMIRHAGDLDDPEFNNVHLEVMWPNAA